MTTTLREYLRALKALATPALPAKKDTFNFCAFSERPLILFTSVSRTLYNIFEMSSRLADEEVTFIVGLSWDLSALPHAVTVWKQYRFHKRLYPNHRIIFACNSATETRLLGRLGCQAEHINKNCFLDEKIYRPLRRVKRYDAILNARPSPFKRHHLAAAVRSLAIIHLPPSGASEKEYLTDLRIVLSHAQWLNYKNGTYTRLTAEEVSEAISAARVGLALSASEGQCQAVGEYLLCGLPVVSTQSKGGRDALFSSRTALIVSASASEVARAVDAFVACPPDVDEVRQITLQKIWVFRERLARVLNRVVESCGGETKDAAVWFKFIPNKAKRFCDPQDFKPVLANELRNLTIRKREE